MKGTLLILGVLIAGYAQALPKRVVTFNTGLTTLFDTNSQNIKTRTVEIIKALRSLDADVFCLQEVWYDVVERYIVEELRLTHPYSFSANHENSTTMFPPRGTPPCRTAGFGQFFRCMIRCSQNSNSTDELIQCSIDHCGLMTLPDDCITCLSTHSNALACGSFNSTRVNRPGLLLLSKFDIMNPSVNYFHTGKKILVPNAFIESDIDGLGKTICSHLAADLGPTYLETGLSGTFTSYEQQNVHQTNQLVAITSPYSVVTLMGCLNTGPAVAATGVSAEFPQSYAALTAAGFTNVFVDQVGKCTYCSENGFVESNMNYTVDHIMIKGLTASQPKIVLDQPFVIRDKKHPQGIEYQMSDHSGVIVTIA